MWRMSCAYEETFYIFRRLCQIIRGHTKYVTKEYVKVVCVTVLQCDTVPWRNEYVKCIVDTLLQCVAVCCSALQCAAVR